jgi:hypothetical protein
MVWYLYFVYTAASGNMIVPWKKKYFEYLDGLLVSFRLRFVAAEESSCIFTMYDLLVLIVKKISQLLPRAMRLILSN